MFILLGVILTLLKLLKIITVSWFVIALVTFFPEILILSAILGYSVIEYLKKEINRR